MSGIFGIWYQDGRPLDPELLSRMSERLEHRGPDGVRTWRRPSLGLGHCTMYSTPESLGELQPLVGMDPEVVLTADVRLDNRGFLLTSLDFRQSPAEVSDADLVLAAYRRWGERCPEHLLGDFAIAIWDVERRELLCVRDHFGVRPLYYVSAPGMFAFASEIEALLSIPEVPDEVDELEIGRHLYLPIGSDKRATYYRHVRRLLPAHSMRVSHEGTEERGYWRLDETRKLALSSDVEYVEAFRASFEAAVRHRLRSTTSVSSMLSGGLDSSAVTCVASRILEDSGDRKMVLQTLSALYPTVPESDERLFIDKVLGRYDLKPHFFNAETVNPFSQIDSINRFVGGANYGGNLYLNWELYGIASREGVRVVLDGYDGDSIVSHGWTYLTELATTGRWLKLASMTIPYSRRQGRAPVRDYLTMVGFGLRHRFRETAAEDLVRWARRRGSGSREQRFRLSWDPVVQDAFAIQFSDRVPLPTETLKTEREAHARTLNSQSLMEILGWVEAVGAGQGVEVRFPFFDVKLAELCLSMPPDQKIRRGWTRFVMRRAMEGVLPPEIQWRTTKAGMGAGYEFAYRTNRNARIEALLAGHDGIVDRYVNIERLRALHENFMRGEATLGESRMLARALTLALWLDAQSERSASSMRPSAMSSEQ
jgi:asparagine synthase (glutamine-hydrolysing)